MCKTDRTNSNAGSKARFYNYIAKPPLLISALSPQDSNYGRDWDVTIKQDDFPTALDWAEENH